METKYIGTVLQYIKNTPYSAYIFIYIQIGNYLCFI